MPTEHPMWTHRVYFAVPDTYTIGREFDSWRAAAAHAESTMKWLPHADAYSRAWVDVRLVDDSGDRMIYRKEIIRDSSSRFVADSGSLVVTADDLHRHASH